MSQADIPTSSKGPRWLGQATANRIALITPISVARWLLVLIGIAAIYFFHGFLVPVLAALVIAFASWPLYRRLLDRIGGNTTLGATFALLFILAFLIVPIGIAISYAVEEIRQWISWAVEANTTGAPPPGWILALPRVGEWLGAKWTEHIASPARSVN